MTYSWKTCSIDIKKFVYNLVRETDKIIEDNFVGFYIHGSLSMGGFNPKNSDIDILVVTKKSITTKTKRKLAQLFLTCSNSPYPVEVSFLNTEQLRIWSHPFPYDFHYSEYWRERFEKDLLMETYEYLNGDIKTDNDLAAHITIINHRGICIEGKSIDEVFPVVCKSDYLSSIVGDFEECLENIEEDPIYCTLNLIRVFWYLKEGVISSKQEAGIWGLKTFPQQMRIAIKKVINSYAITKDTNDFEKEELISIRNYISDKVQGLLRA